MKINENNIELFDKFLRKELSEEERLNFENNLKENAEFKNEFEEFVLLVDGIRMKGLEDLKGILKSKGEVKYWGNLWGPKWTIASAAILAIFTIMFYILEYYVPKKSNLETQIALEETISTEEQVEELEEKIENTEILSETNEKESVLEKEPEIPISLEDDIVKDMENEKAEEIMSAPKPNSHSNLAEKSSKSIPVPPTSNKEEISLNRSRSSEPVPDRLISSEKILDSFYKVQILPNGFLKMDAKLLDTFLFNNEEWADVRIAFWSSPLNTIAYSNKSGFKNIKLSKLDIYGWEPTLLTNLLIEGFGGDLYVKYNQKVYLLKNGTQNMPMDQIKDKTKLAKLEILWN